MDCLRELEGKQVHDPSFSSSLYKWVPGPIVVGAGPSGLAVSACLKQKGTVSLILERSDCIASLWQYNTYDRLHLHLPKQYCELPFMSFPSNFPKYPSKLQFIAYLESYARKFDIRPKFNETVLSAEYDSSINMWRVKTNKSGYVSKWLIISTGENAEIVMPNIKGMDEYKGIVMHTSLYKSGDSFRDKNVLVVGCGNSGMEVCFDLRSFNARPTIVVRDAVHVLPIEVMGYSTFALSMLLLKWLPIRVVDCILLFIARVMHGDTSCMGLHRPLLGPLELKSKTGKTPVLDIGTLAKIKSGEIEVRPAIKRLTKNGAEFVDGKSENFDAIILATGYKSNIPSWLKENKLISDKDGLPKYQFPDGWQGENGLYAVGLTRRGLMGASIDARKIAEDIKQCWDKMNTKILQKFG